VAYHLKHTQLRALRKLIIIADPKLLANTRLLILEHILPTTEGLILQLQEAGSRRFSRVCEAVFCRPRSLG
jgi:hypothetical protein